MFSSKATDEKHTWIQMLEMYCAKVLIFKLQVLYNGKECPLWWCSNTCGDGSVLHVSVFLKCVYLQGQHGLYVFVNFCIKKSKLDLNLNYFSFGIFEIMA